MQPTTHQNVFVLVDPFAAFLSVAAYLSILLASLDFQCQSNVPSFLCLCSSAETTLQVVVRIKYLLY